MLLLWVLSLLALSLADPCPQGTTYEEQMNLCYHFISDPLSFLDAERNCHSMSGDLVSIGSAFENTLIDGVASYAFAGKADFWIGASFYGNFDQWMWMDLSPLTYSKWAPGEPASSECGSMQVNGGRWEAAPCNVSKPFVCMTAAAPKPKCDENWKFFEATNSCYYYSSDDQPFNRAEAACVSLGAHLASVHSWMELAFIVGGYSYGLYSWSGTYTNGSGWMNTDGSPVYTDHLPAATGGQECLSVDIETSSGTWYSPFPCDYDISVVCKKAANY